MTAVGINGLGRIGRLLARRMYERDDARHNSPCTHVDLPALGGAQARAALEIIEDHLADSATNPETSLAGPFTEPGSSTQTSSRPTSS